EDLKLASAAGATMVRWGVPWYKVEAEKGKFDWSWVDDVLDYMVFDLGLQPIVDLVHYGTPEWLDGSFLNPEYPERVAEFARRFAQRYGHMVKCYTPTNEPTVNADWAGRKAQWPPYTTGDQGYVDVLLALAR